jgi:putative hydrolase of the HAD superfamily
MIRAIFFDVGYTLLQPAASTSEICRRFLRTYGQDRSLNAIESAMLIVDQGRMVDYHAFNDDWAHPGTILMLWLRYYRRLFNLLDVPDDGEQLAREIIMWYGQPQAWQPFPDVVDTLERLQESGFRLGAVSDWAPTLLSILQAHGLTRHLDFVLCSGAIGFCKPSVQFYQLALQRAGVQPHQALHIGDSYHADVRGALAAGIRPVLLDRTGTAPPVDCYVVRELAEIEDIVHNLRSA